MMTITNKTSRPLVLAFLSGKGGVGKTMLAVAAARELARGQRTLLIDLDFFNRGLTGLMPQGKLLGQLSPPLFLQLDGTDAAEAGLSKAAWELREVSKNLVHISYPDIPPQCLRNLEAQGIKGLEQGLNEFVLSVASQAQCDCVVLDCHGGPDATSFAACAIADHSLIISEPDRITFYGTMNFVRQLQRVAGGRKFDLRLVFNKVVPAFSGIFLRRLYRAEIRRFFGGNRLLAIFPLEIYLTKAFEQTPFLSDALPNSWLAKKTNVMLRDLLGDPPQSTGQPKFILPAARGLPSWLLWWRRNVVGSGPRWLSLDLLFPIIALGALACFGANKFFESQPNNNMPYYAMEARSEWTLLKIESIRFYSQNSGLSMSTTVSNYLKENFVAMGVTNYLGDRLKAEYLFDALRKDSVSSPAVTNLVTNLRLLISTDVSYSMTHLADARNRWIDDPDPFSPVDASWHDTFQSALEELKDSDFTIARIQSDFEGIASIAEILASMWFGLALWLNWSIVIDRKFVFYLRTGRRFLQYPLLLLAIVIWGFAVWLATGTIWVEVHSIEDWMQAIILALIFLSLFIEEIARVYRDLRYDPHRVESYCRLIFLLVLFGIGLVINANN